MSTELAAKARNVAALILPEPSFPHVIEKPNGSITPRPTMENLQALMRHYQIDVRYNVSSKRLDVFGIKAFKGDEENALYAELLSKAELHSLRTSHIDAYISRIAKEHAHNPVVEFLDALPTVSGDPFPRFVEHCGFEPPDWALIACRRWFIQTVAAADHADKSANPSARPEFPYVLTLAGDQGLSKTALMYQLLPQQLQPYFAAGRMLDTNNKDSVVEAVSSWIVELGEIDSTFRKSDIASLKAFLTKQTDSVRMPYAKSWSHMERRTSYMATVNENKFLQDITGNRRFWPLRLNEKILTLPKDMAEQIWSYAWHQYLHGEQWWLTEDEEKIHAAVTHDHEDRPLRECLLDCYDFDSPDRTLMLTTTEIMSDLGLKQQNRGVQTTLGTELRRLGVTRLTNRSRHYGLPPRQRSNLNFSTHGGYNL